MKLTRSLLATVAASAAFTMTSRAHAVTCPTAQTLPVPGGASNFGQSVAMYSDATGDYVIVSSSNATYYFQKPSGSSQPFGAGVQISGAPGGNVVALHGTVLIGTGSTWVFQQALDSSGNPTGAPFNRFPATPMNPTVNWGPEGQKMSYDWSSNTVTSCGFSSSLSGYRCNIYTFDGEFWQDGGGLGPGGVGFSSSFLAIQSTGGQGGAYGYMFGDETGESIRYTGGAPTCSSFPCFNVFDLSFVHNGLPLNFQYNQQLQPVGSASSTTPIYSVATKIDRLFAGVPNGGVGQVRTYSNNLLSGSPGSWQEYGNLRFTSTNAGAQFGAAVAASGTRLRFR